MVLSIVDAPKPTKEKNQRALTPDDLTLTRYIAPWSRPASLSAQYWRAWVLNQPIAIICRETLIANFLSLEWKITSRDSKQQDELKATIRYYTRLLEHGGFNPDNFGMDYSGMMEWLLTDFLDLPFGAAMEIGRREDVPGGRVVWTKTIDSGTLYPTLNKDFPIIQYYSAEKPVLFPAHAIVRMYMSPRTEILREGWGMAPPEKILSAIMMLARGDAYYANLLLDTPPAGFLDLGDMEKDSALEWIDAFRNSQLGNPLDALKIPVLYEHTTPVNFIAFGKPPSEIMFDTTTTRYAQIVCAGYGLSTSDIGLSSSSNGGETLAGSIRQERRSRRTGIGRLKKKVKYFFESVLPDSLQFDIIDPDEEFSVALGRARLANATAWTQLSAIGAFSAQEARLQTINDGLVTINVPEEIPPEAKKAAKAAAAKPPSRPGMLGNPVPASGGGQGEVRKDGILESVGVEKTRHFGSHLKRLSAELVKSFAPILVDASRDLNESDLFLLHSYVEDSLFENDVLGINEMILSAWGRKSWLKLQTELSAQALAEYAEEQILNDVDRGIRDEYEAGESDVLALSDEVYKALLDRIHGVNYQAHLDGLLEAIQENIKSFIGKSILYITKDAILGEDVFDADGNSGYDDVVNQVYKAMLEKFDEFVAGCVELEVQNTLNRIKMEINND